MEAEIKSLKGKIDELCGSVQDLGKSHAVLNVELTGVKEALLKLADVNGELKAIRIESLNLIQQHDECKKGNRKEHDELFFRLRTLESKESACAQDRKSIHEDVDELRGNWKWLVRLGIATALSAMISAAGFIWVVFFRHVSGG